MKRNSFVFLIFFLLLTVSSTSARLLATPRQDGKEVKGHVIPEASSLPETKEDISNLMGSEECDEEDEECQKRRMVAEAHLDYIYTQHHKKP
ncbi:putative phytosulfokines 6 [Ricinus communis]|uniref:putative phytosulfokines 6 n=1 Tax=Ricinus communis TaxID=3988 RepID=UPI00201ADB70|nr:putative phytosulfokines 6 [Ricinus communis]